MILIIFISPVQSFRNPEFKKKIKKWSGWFHASSDHKILTKTSNKITLMMHNIIIVQRQDLK